MDTSTSYDSLSFSKYWSGQVDIIICDKLEFSKVEKLIIFHQFHDSIIGGHAGLHRTIKKIKIQFNWRGLKEDVIKHIKNCASCQKGKRHVTAHKNKCEKVSRKSKLKKK